MFSTLLVMSRSRGSLPFCTFVRYNLIRLNFLREFSNHGVLHNLLSKNLEASPQLDELLGGQ